MLFDTHTHIYLWELWKNKQEVVQDFLDNSWKYMINIWVDLKSSLEVCEIAKEFECSFATVWIHPCYVMDLPWTPEENIEKLREIYEKNKDIIVWIWEAWLDNYHISETETDKERELQETYFRLQIRLAKELDIPLIIHTRNAPQRTLEILEEEKSVKFLIHCFSENLDFAQKCMKISDECIFAFWWVVTYKKSFDVQNACINLPIEKIVAETDAPYLAPQVFRWKVNKPHYINETIKYIAEIRWDNFEITKEKLFKNSVKFFKVK